MRIIKDALTRDELNKAANALFGNMIKAVVDIDRKIVAIDAELHSDLEALLLEDGSNQKNLWGLNLYPEIPGDDFVEFDAMINLKPSQGNRSRGVEDVKIQKEIMAVVAKWVQG